MNEVPTPITFVDLWIALAMGFGLGFSACMMVLGPKLHRLRKDLEIAMAAIQRETQALRGRDRR